MTDSLDIDALTFDILGTMVDEPGGIRRGVRTCLPETADSRTTELVTLWHEHVDAQQREIVEGRRAWASSTEIDLEAATRVAHAAGVDDLEAIESLASSAQKLDPWPDSVAGLGRLAERFPVMGLSNASRSALTRINAYAGLRWHAALSAEEARSYKPHPDVYGLAIANAGSPPERLLMVAAHAWDLRGAQAAGMRTAYVARPIGDPPTGTDSFDLSVGSLDELADALSAAR